MAEDDTQDAPALDQNDATEQERLDGLVAQLRADHEGQDAATVEKAVRRRLDDTGIAAGEDLVQRLVAQIAG